MARTPAALERARTVLLMLHNAAAAAVTSSRTAHPFFTARIVHGATYEPSTTNRATAGFAQGRMSNDGIQPTSADRVGDGTRDGGRGRGGGGGRGRGRGRGKGRGLGGGRGGAPEPQSVAGPSAPGESTASGREMPKPRLTHFIALPIGHHAGLRERMGAFTDALLTATPAVPGLDATVVIPPRRLHFTLGVMSLDVYKETPQTLEAAKTVLQELRPKIMKILDGEKLSVRLDRMNIMKPERGGQGRANVMWVGPSFEGESARRLRRVADVIVEAFRRADLLVDEKRQLKLHCTVVNTIYRKPRGRVRTPFSYSSVLASDALKAVRVQEAGQQDEHMGNLKGPVRVDFGEWAVEVVEVCEMGSWGPEGEYVAVARCPL